MEESAGLKQNVLPREGVLPKGRGRAARKGRAAKEELAALGAGGDLKHGSEVCAGLHETGAGSSWHLTLTCAANFDRLQPSCGTFIITVTALEEFTSHLVREVYMAYVKRK